MRKLRPVQHDDVVEIRPARAGDDAPPSERLANPYFGLHRVDEGDGAATFILGYGDWIRLLRRCGLDVEDHIELRPPGGASTAYEPFATLEWARRWPLERLTRNESVLDPEVVAVLLGRRAGHDPLSRLTPREREVLALMAEGRSNRGIGQSLFLSANTVETHIRNVFCKLDLSAAPDDHRRVLAVLNYLGR